MIYNLNISGFIGGIIMENRKAVFFDIDGTLIMHTDKGMIFPESTKRAIKQLRGNGHLTFICSGRPIRFVNQEFHGMFDGYVCCNGTYLVYENKCIYNKLIDENMIKFLIKEFNRLGISASFSGAYNGYSYNMDKNKIYDMNRFYKRGEPYMIEKWQVHDVKANVLDVFFKSKNHLEECTEYFKDKLVFNTHEPYLSADVSFKDWDKACGIKYIIKYIGINIDDTVAFGDGKNDITMIKTVKEGIAMGNAVLELKKEANMVTDSVLQNGIYNALNKLKLI